MLLTPALLLKMNTKYGWGLCSEGMCEFISAYPDGVEVTKENYKKLRRRFGYAIDNVAEQAEFNTANEEYHTKEGYTDVKFNADKFLEIFNKLIEKMNKPKAAKVAAKQ